jgi:hypothetical protein
VTSKFVYLLGADEVDMGDFGDAFVIYQGQPWRCAVPTGRT